MDAGRETGYDIKGLHYEQVLRVEVVNNCWFREFDKAVDHYLMFDHAREPELVAKSLWRLPVEDLRVAVASLQRLLGDYDAGALKFGGSVPPAPEVTA